MKICVFGSRELNNYKLVKPILDLYHSKIPITEIVSGKCRGADSLGERWAKENKIAIKEFPADWSLGKKAGPLRNEEMAKYCDEGIGFSVNSSRGAANMRANLTKLGKKCYFMEVEFDYEEQK